MDKVILDEIRGVEGIESLFVVDDVIQLVVFIDLGSLFLVVFFYYGDVVGQVFIDLIVQSIFLVVFCVGFVFLVVEYIILFFVLIGDGVEVFSFFCLDLVKDFSRSFDFEEVFEILELMIFVKVLLVLFLLFFEVILEFEVSVQLFLEELGCGFEIVFVFDGLWSDLVEGSFFCFLLYFFFVVFDEDKLIVSSGIYNLDFDNIEFVDIFQILEFCVLDGKNQEGKVNIWRKFMDFVFIFKFMLFWLFSL